MSEREIALISLESGSWEDVFEGEPRSALEAILPAYIQRCRWFGGKARTIAGVEIAETIRVPDGATATYVTLIAVKYAEGDSQTYVLPLTFASGQQAHRVRSDTSQAVVAILWTEGDAGEGVLYDATSDKGFARLLLDAVEKGSRFESGSGEIAATPRDAFQSISEAANDQLEPSVIKGEQSNTSIVYGKSFILKLFRRLEEGTSPDLEVTSFLTDRGFANTPPLAGAIEYVRPDGEPLTIAILQGFVPNQGDAWNYTLQSLSKYYKSVIVERADAQQVLPWHDGHLLDLIAEDIPPAMVGALGSYLDSARLLGRRTAEMHIILASDPDDLALAPVSFTPAYQNAMYEATRGLIAQAFRLLGNRLEQLPDIAKSDAQEAMSHQEQLLERFRPLLDHSITALRTRCHGDYHLGQILYTGSDFVIIDFEGEPLRPLSERRDKHSPLKDVAGMLRSFHYAAYAGMFNEQSSDSSTEPWADAWHLWVSAAYLKEYLAVADGAHFLPGTRQELQMLLDTHLLEKAIYELIYELNNRPDWVRIPLQGILELVGQ